jgi:predicted DNA-binding helix-hairpin-helix protein
MHLDLFPVEINRADKEMLLRVPGFGIRSVNKILRARRYKAISILDLHKIKISLKRARYFITVRGRRIEETKLNYEYMESTMLALEKPKPGTQPTLFDQIQTNTGEI